MKAIIFYSILIIAAIFCINYLADQSGFLTVEYSNIKSIAYDLEKLIDLK